MNWTSSKVWKILLVLLVIGAIWVPRVLDLYSFVTPDERAWLTRSANFYHALATGEFANTYQTEHPGVTIMWTGMISFLWAYPDYVQEAPAEFTWLVEELEPFLQQQGYMPLDLLMTARFFMVLSGTFILTAAYWYAIRLLGFWGALFGFLLLAFDPFHIAHSRVLHMDAMLSNLMLLSTLAFLSYLIHSKPSDLIISGIMAGFAWLTKSPTLFLGPFVALLVLISLLHIWRTKNELNKSYIQKAIISLICWTVIGLLVVLLFWPVMWVDPLGTIEKVVGTALFHASEGHEHPIYFNGTIFRGDPGLGFYLITYLWRVTPVVLIGLFLAGLAFLRGSLTWQQKQVMGALLLFAVLYMLVMEQGAKKFDRYFLPVYAPLNLIAAMGWIKVVQWLFTLNIWPQKAESPPSLTQWGTPLLLSALLFIQLSIIVPLFPYYLSYYNPLLGGPTKAPDVMMVGWGEGLELAAAYLNQQPNAEQMQVMSWYADGPFSYFFQGKSIRIQPFDRHLAEWLESDYVLSYVNLWQRNLPSPDVLAYLEQQPPEHVVEINGMEHVRIYNMRSIEPFDPLLSGRPAERYACEEQASLVDWNGAIRLLDVEVPREAVRQGEAFEVTFPLQAIASIERNINVLLRVLGPNGEEIIRDDGWPWGTATSNWPPCQIRPDGHQLSIPAEVPSGYYQLELSFYDNDTLYPLFAQESKSGTRLGQTWIAGYLPVGELPTPPADTPTLATLGENEEIKLWSGELNGSHLGATHPLSAAERLDLRLFWQAQANIINNYTVFVHLIAPDGQLLQQRDQQPQNGFFPTSFWQAKQTIADNYQLDLPSDAPTGRYELRVGMYDATTGQRLPVNRNGEPIGDSLLLTTIEVRADE